MAGDWIKMRVDLQSHPKIVRILSATSTDKFRVLGGLHAVWAVFDTHSVDGELKGYTPDLLDHVIGWDGFARAMESVGWLAYDGLETLTLPEFTEHNGQSAKRRAEDQKRKRDTRKCPQSVRTESADDADQKRTREEKRREDKEQKQKPPRTKEKDLTLAEWVLALPDDEEVIVDADPIFDWALKIGVPRDWVALAWFAFEGRYGDNPKRYTDWRAVFRKALREDWLKLWRKDSRTGGWVLTPAGEMAERERQS